MPSPLPAGSPGDVIQAEPQVLDSAPLVPLPGVTAQRIMYRSTDRGGEPVAVTGTVITPSAPWTGPGQRPIVGLAVGTQGVANPCAPSRQLDAGTEYELLEMPKGAER